MLPGVVASELRDDVCIVGRTQIQLRTVAEKLKAANVEQYAISRDSTDKVSIPGVRLANMHRINGLYATWYGARSRLIA